ncbi:sister chromatid cohesion protein Dcc1 [Mycena filopes]|nr:sister chromatid cohesion protein Dcc1 [Mycena filopes]
MPSNNDAFRLSIKGQSGEDAVLCTNDTTYTIRSVVLSNSILVVTPPPSSESTADVVIRDQVNEVLELTPAVPKLHKLSTLLRGREYDDGLSYAAARATVQASDAELARGLREHRILNIHGALRPIAPAFLTSILESILNLLVSQSMAPSAISRTVSTQVMEWFGEVRDGVWTMDIGLGILRQHKDEPIEKDMLLGRWKSAVGDTFEARVALPLLSGNYLVSSGPMGNGDLLTYFPSSALPVDPPNRFIDLFLTRPRWKADEIGPFLSDIAVNTKERDKLLLKYTRATTDSQGVWYTKK